MPVSPTYPGLYIEELPSSAYTITPAPTSITVFVGYVHPFVGQCAVNGDWRIATQIFNFTDYQRLFGGLYRNEVLRSDVADAVYQFFLNGGSSAYVVPLQPHYVIPPTGVGMQPTTQAMEPAAGDVAGIHFKSKQLTDTVNKVSITISNVRTPITTPPTPANSVADIVVTFGSTVEQYRNVTTAPTLTSADPNFLATRLTNSALVSVAPSNALTTNIYSAAFPTTPLVIALDLGDMGGPAGAGTYLEADFTAVFAEDSSLDKVDIFNLLVIPGISDAAVWAPAISFCDRKLAFYIVDPPPNASADTTYEAAGMTQIYDLIGQFPHVSANAALYFPYLNTIDPLTGNTVAQPPSGFVAGVYARTDTNRGVWKAPAGLETALLNTTGVVESGRMTDMRQGTVNRLGVNVLRSFPGTGTVVWGARTLGTILPLQQWWYVPVRRMALFIEQTLLRNLGWVVFEPNDSPLWTAIRVSVESFMMTLFRQQAFFGATPSDAFRVQCDATTTTDADINKGIVNIVVAFRPLKPAEFVIIQIAQLAGQAQQ